MATTKFKLQIREHEEFGGMGISIRGNGRDYFDPATAGFTLAHDILEHPIKPHYDGYVDELMAIGGLIAGRIEQYWAAPYGRTLRLEDIADDIQILALASLINERGNFHVDKCTHRIQNADMMETIRREVRKGLLAAVNEYEDEDYQYLPRKYNFDVNSMAGHIARGYQLFKKRFGSLGYNFVHLFDQLTKQANKFLEGAEEYQEGILTINFKTQRVWIDQYYEEVF
jgi:hypothetical protein